jgi:GDPmannose 4,6-dehydratase
MDSARYVRFDPALYRPPEDTPPVGDITKARERLGWEPETSFEAMVEEMVLADLSALREA